MEGKKNINVKTEPHIRPIPMCPRLFDYVYFSLDNLTSSNNRIQKLFSQSYQSKIYFGIIFLNEFVRSTKHMLNLLSSSNITQSPRALAQKISPRALIVYLTSLWWVSDFVYPAMDNKSLSGCNTILVFSHFFFLASLFTPLSPLYLSLPSSSDRSSILSLSLPLFSLLFLSLSLATPLTPL